MWKSSLFLQGIEISVCLWICTLQNVAVCETVHNTHVYHGDEYTPTSNAKQTADGDHSRPRHNGLWRHSEASSYGDGMNAAVAGQVPANSGAAAAGLLHRAEYSGGPVVVHGGSVIVQRPEGFVIDDDGNEFGVGHGHPGSGQLAGGPGPLPVGFGAFLPVVQQQSLFDYPMASLLGSNSGLLQRLLFGQAAAANPFDRYLSFCNRMTVIGRFLGRLFRPLFTAGFYMAASYVLRKSVLPRIAHYLYSYAAAAAMTDPMHGGLQHDHGRLGDGDRLSRDMRDLTAAMTDVIYDAPCLRKIACETGLRVASNPIAGPFKRMAKQIISKHELAHIFEKSITGSVSECNQYVCKTKTKAKL